MSEPTEGNAGGRDPRRSVAPLTRAEIKGLSGVGILALAWVTLPALFGFWLLAEIGNVSDWFDRWEIDHGLVISLLVYVAVFALSSGLGLLPTYAQAFLGGWVVTSHTRCSGHMENWGRAERAI